MVKKKFNIGIIIAIIVLLFIAWKSGFIFFGDFEHIDDDFDWKDHHFVYGVDLEWGTDVQDLVMIWDEEHNGEVNFYTEVALGNFGGNVQPHITLTGVVDTIDFREINSLKIISFTGVYAKGTSGGSSFAISFFGVSDGTDVDWCALPCSYATDRGGGGDNGNCVDILFERREGAPWVCSNKAGDYDELNFDKLDEDKPWYLMYISEVKTETINGKANSRIIINNLIIESLGGNGEGEECTTDDDCEFNQICEDEECKNLECDPECEDVIEHECVWDYDRCPTGECETNGDCLTDEICVDGFCEKLDCEVCEKPLNHECFEIADCCVDDADCDDDNQYTEDKCVNNECAYREFECIFNDDCDDDKEWTIDECIDEECINTLCIPDWECEYTECIDGKQDKIRCIDNNECGTDWGAPPDERDCTPECDKEFDDCTEWTNCIEGHRYQICYNDCGDEQRQTEDCEEDEEDEEEEEVYCNGEKYEPLWQECKDGEIKIKSYIWLIGGILVFFIIIRLLGK